MPYADAFAAVYPPLIKSPKNLKSLALTFDDIQILPNYSDIESRSIIKTKVRFTKELFIDIPFIASPMVDVVDVRMAKTLYSLGGVGVIHRFMTIDEQCKQVEEVSELAMSFTQTTAVCAAVGVGTDAFDRVMRLQKAGATCILIDVANGHSIHVKKLLEKLNMIRSKFNMPFQIIAGSIATVEAAIDLTNWGADALRVGIGNGSACTTRIQTGIGQPQATAINEIAQVTNLPIIADGGIRTSGDMAKALCLGADSVMCGRLFAGHDESPGEVIDGKKVYRGSASFSIKQQYMPTTDHVEGVSGSVTYKGPVEKTVRSWLDGLTSCASYLGVDSLDKMHHVAKFVQVTQAGLQEAHPHIK